MHLIFKMTKRSGPQINPALVSGKKPRVDVPDQDAPLVATINNALTKCVNAALQNELMDLDRRIMGCQQYEGLLEMLPTSQSGVQPYDKTKCKTELAAGNSYICSCPFYWLNVNYEFQPNIPKHRINIENLKDHFFAEPGCKYPIEGITVVLDKNSTLLPHELKGQLEAVCSPGLRDAFRTAVAGSIVKADKHAITPTFVARENRLGLNHNPCHMFDI